MDAAQIEKALDEGRRMAALVLDYRSEALGRRAEAMRKREVTVAPAEVEAERMASAEMVRAAGGAQSAGVLVAEGDSWFDYPWTDVLGELEDEHGFDVESVAHKGDRIEEMAYSGGQLEELTRRIEKVLRRGQRPRAILLSGGGNDIAGDDLAVILNHAQSAAPGLNEAVVQGVIGERIRLAYITILSAVTDLCQARLQRPIPILVHGYDYAIPDGRGFWGGWGVLPGPWLEPGLRQKGYRGLDRGKQLIKELMDHFNEMLQEVVELPEFDHVRYVDLRGTLSPDDDYETWWSNELHPTKRGFRRVAKRFAAEL